MSLELTESKYKDKDGNERIGYNTKFADTKPDTPVILDKKYEGYFKEGNSKYGQWYLVNFEYDGKKVSTFMGEAVFQKWDALPVGYVKFTNELVKKDKGWSNQYKFESVDAQGNASSSSSSESQQDNTPSVNTVVLTDKQRRVLKYMVDNNVNPDADITVDGKLTTYRQFLGDLVVNSPKQYL